MATMSQETKDGIKAVISKKARFATFEIKDLSITAAKVSDRKVEWKDFKRALPDTEPRYALYDLEYKTKDGRQTSKVYSVFWKPENSNQKNAVIYSQALDTFKKELSGVVHVNLSDHDEVEELLQNESFG